MSNTITFKVKVEKDGNLSVIAKQAEKAAKSTDKLGASTDRTTKARNRFNKAEKGVGQAGLSSGKAFSKMQSTMGGGGGLVAAYAVLAANIFALTAAFGALSRAAQVQKLKEGMVAMGQSTGVAMNALSENLVRATGHAISLEEAMRTTAQVTSAGFDPSVIERLGNVAKMASQALGRDLGDAMQRITKGAIKMEPELLDELGIMVRLDDATATYAASIGKNVDELSKFEKQQAFMNAVLEEGETKFAALGDVDVNPYTKLSATFANLTETLLNFFNKALSPIIEMLANNTGAMVGALLIFASTVGRMVQPALAAFTEKLAKSAKASADAAVAQVKLTASTGKGSTEVLKLKNALIKGEATQKQWNKGLLGAQRSVTGYRNALNNNIKSTGHFSKATIASQRALRQAETDHYALIRAKAGLDLANIKNSETSALATLSTLGFSAAVKLLWADMAGVYVQTMLASTGMGIFGKMLHWVKGVTAAAALGFKFLGASILMALNVVGLIIMALYVLWEAAKWLWSFTKTAEDNALVAASEAASTAMKDTKENLLELDAAYDGQKTKIQGVVGQYKALKNILDTSVQTYRKMAVAQAEADASRFFKKGGDTNQGASALVGHVLELAEGSKIMQKTLADAGISMDQLRSGEVTLNQLNTAMDLVDTTNKKVNVRFLGMAAAIDGLNEPLQTFMNKIKQKTDVDELVKGFDDLSLTLTDPKFATGPEKLAAFSEMADEGLMKLLGTSAKVLEDAKGNEAAEAALLKTLLGRFDVMKKIFKDEQKAQILHKKKLSNLKQEIKLIKSRAGVAGNAALQFEAENELIDVKAHRMQEEIDRQKNLNRGRSEESNINQSILAMERELATFLELKPGLEQKALLVAKEKLLIAQNSQKATKLELDSLEKMAKINTKLIEFADNAAGNAQRAKNRANPARGFDPTLTNQDQLDLETRPVDNVKGMGKDGKEVNLGEGTAAQARLEAARADLNLAFMRLDLERQMSLLRLDVLDAEMRLLHQKKIDAKNAHILKEYGVSGQFGEATYGTYEDDGQISGKASGASIINRVRDMAMEGGTLDAANKALLNATFDNLEANLNEKTLDLEDGTRTDVLGQGGDTTAEVMQNQDNKGGIGALKNTSDQFKAMHNQMQPMIETLRSLGPEGELVAAVAQGAFVISESMAKVGETFKALSDDNTFEANMKRGAAVAGAVASTLSQVSSIMQASSKAKIAGIDQEIAAEKKRDGKSKESLARLKALEAKKEAAKRKAFEANKKMQMAQAVANTAAGIMMALGTMEPPFSYIAAAITAAMGMAQLAVISGTSYQGGGSGGGANVPGSVSLGQRKTSVDAGKSTSSRGELSYFRGERGSGGPENFKSAFYGKKHRASGGSTGYVVGEQGPELFMPDRPGTIVPADDLASSGGGTNVSFNISAIDAAGVEEVLMEQQGTIISMLRQAANSYGEDFMEDVDESTYTTPAVGRA